MRLTELEPQFLVTYEDGGERHRYVDTLAEANGIIFLCPTCFTKNAGPVGTHAILVNFADRGLPDHLGSHGHDKQPTRWTASGTGMGDLSLTPSIDISQAGDGEWHGYITNGEIR